MNSKNDSRNLETENGESSASQAKGTEPAEEQTTSARSADLVADSVENYLQSYHSIAEWIRFADAKAAVVLTVNGALASILIPTLKPFIANRMQLLGIEPGKWQWSIFHWEDFASIVFNLSVGFFFLWMALLIVSGAFAFLCITPFRRRGRHPALPHCGNFHPAAIANRYRLGEYERFTEETMDAGMKGLEKQVLVGILIDSHISNVKYRRVTASIKFFALSVVFGFGYLLLKQF